MLNNITENSQNDLNDLINYGKWEMSLISSLKTEKNYKKNLILIDKDWLSQWKEITGYNYIKSQIFKYLSYIQKNDNKDNISEETKKLNNLWSITKNKYSINQDNLQKLKLMNNKQYLINHNNRKLINGQKKFDIISNDIYDIFKKYLEKNINIKVGGLFANKKLLMPFNYNDKNINYIYIDMLFINNNKNDIEEILFIFPNLNINIIEKIRKEITNKDINEYIKDINDKEEKEFYFIDENQNKFSYKAIYKNISQNNKNTYNKINSNNIIDNNETEEINNINNINNFDVNNLTLEELENKIKEIDEKTNKLIEKQNDLNEQENSYINEQNEFDKEKKQFDIEKNNILNKKSSKSLNDLNNDIELEEEYNNYSEHLKEMEFKNQHIFDEIQEFKQKEIIFNNEYKKYKNNFQQKLNELNNKINDINNKENQIKIKDGKLITNLHKKEIEVKNKEEELNLKEVELNLKEKELEEKEIELDEEEKNIKKKKYELKQKNSEVSKKMKNLQKIEQKNVEKFNNEVDEELNELENQINENEPKLQKQKSVNDIVNESEENDEDENDNVIGKNNNRISLNEADTFKYRKMKSVQNDKAFPKINNMNNLKSSKNVNSNIENKYKVIDKKISNPFYIRSKTLTTPNITNSLSSKNLPLTIDTSKPSLGLSKQKQVVNLNAIMQCFVHLKEITEGILTLNSQNFFNDDNKFKLSKVYLNLIINLFFPEKYNNKNGFYSISSFYDIINKENKELLNDKFYCNSKDLLDIIIKGLHKELNTKLDINKNSNWDKTFEELNEKDALVKYLDIFTKNNNSIISKNLYGLLKNKVICQGCKKEKYSFKYYSFLSFNIKDIKTFINKENQKIKLKDFFDYYNRPEYLLEENGLYCNCCKSKNTTTILKSIYSSHIIMPIIIDRGDDSNLNKDKIDFPDELDLSKYIEYNKCSKNFYLCGVVSNFGLSNNFGKFEAFCKMEKNGPWFHYDNEIVTSCTNEEVHNRGIQYILFYHKI